MSPASYRAAPPRVDVYDTTGLPTGRQIGSAALRPPSPDAHGTRPALRALPSPTARPAASTASAGGPSTRADRPRNETRPRHPTVPRPRPKTRYGRAAAGL